MALIADDEASELIDPGESALHHPAMFAEVLAAFDAASGDARCDVTGAEITAAAAEVVAFVGVQFGRSLAGSAAALANRLDRVDDVDQGLAVVAVGAGQDEGERQAAPIHHDVPLGAGFAPIRRVRADRVTPLLAATDEESTEARDQSMWPARLRRSSMCR